MSNRDRIEREVQIDAPVERVWAIVSEAGWWIGDGDRSGQTRRREGELEIVEDPKYGSFPVRIVALEPQRYASYRCTWYQGEQPSEENSTLIEFWLSERDGGTLLRLVESGFASMRDGDTYIDGNIEGWAQQLEILKTLSEQVAA